MSVRPTGRVRTRNYEHSCLLRIRRHCIRRNTPYLAVIGTSFFLSLSFSWPFSPNDPDTHPPTLSRPSSRPFVSRYLTSSSPCLLSRRQAVKNDRGVSLVGQWQIEYILASSEKRVLRFVYRLSCYAKERNFCRLRIRRNRPLSHVCVIFLRRHAALHYRSAQRWHTTITTTNDSKWIQGIKRERSKSHLQ